MIETDLWINGGQFWGILVFFAVVALVVSVGLMIQDYLGAGIFVATLAILAGTFGIVMATTTHDAAYSNVVRQIHEQGFKDPITINGQTFTSGERWCALKPINGDDATVFKIVCEEDN